MIAAIKEFFKGEVSKVEATALTLTALGHLAKLLDDGRHYLMGSKPSLPDFIMFEHLQYCKHLCNQTFDYYPQL